MAKALVEEEDSETEFERLYSELNAARAAFFAPTPVNPTTNRRGLFLGAVTAGAATSVAVIPANGAPTEPDPVFALIEAHKTAWTRLLETEDRTE